MIKMTKKNDCTTYAEIVEYDIHDTEVFLNIINKIKTYEKIKGIYEQNEYDDGSDYSQNSIYSMVYINFFDNIIEVFYDYFIDTYYICIDKDETFSLDGETYKEFSDFVDSFVDDDKTNKNLLTMKEYIDYSFEAFENVPELNDRIIKTIVNIREHFWGKNDEFYYKVWRAIWGEFSIYENNTYFYKNRSMEFRREILNDLGLKYIQITGEE